MASTKAALKSIKSLIDAKDYERAAQEAQDVVKQDSKNYHAFMFLGFAQEKLHHYDEAEKALNVALSIKEQDLQAFKGLVTLYEQQAASKLDQYHGVAHDLAKLYANLDNRDQCQTVIDKYELFAKKHGSRLQYRKALELLLPSSDLYDTLEGRVPHPAHTYRRILESCATEEDEWITSQINERRTRLGARIDQVTREVRSEAVFRFRMEEHYQSLIDWTIDDDARHQLEEELLRRAYQNLQVVPREMKPDQRDKVLTMANGMVIIKHRFPLAWEIALEWVDAEDLAEWDVNIFKEYVEFFPDDGLSKVLQGFLESKASPFTGSNVLPDEEDAVKTLSEADQLIVMVQGLQDAQNSMLAHRIMAHTYLVFEEDRSAVETGRKAQSLYVNAQTGLALALQNSIDAVNLTLANALITFQSPRHHPEARGLFQSILDRKPTLTAALLGIGLILEEDEDYGEASKFLKQALDRDSENIRIQLEYAWCHALAQDLASGLDELEKTLERIESQKQPNPEMKAQVFYRIAYCKWEIAGSAAARKDKSGPYRYLIESVKADQSYAPAYTLLGIYFQDYGKSKQRARVALQKAFELSTSELVAAERLARVFANSGEWDLVELVAQRVVDSGKARPAPGSKKKAHSWPYAALGVVQMNRQQYSDSIVSFQAALRISPQDYHSWVGLGESYHNSGRYIAASRAFQKAESIEHDLPADQTWFAHYMLANVQREMGAFDNAIGTYEAVLETKQDEFGVLLALLQTYAENAWAKLLQGLFGKAVDNAQKAILVAQRIANQKTDVFNLWKATSDACSAIGHAKSIASEVDIDAVVSLLRSGSVDDCFVALADIDKVDIDVLRGSSEAADKFLYAAILANKRSIYATTHDTHAQAVSWFNLGWTEHEAYVSISQRTPPSSKKSTKLLKAAMRCFKRAIELEAANADFWNALGVTAMTLSPKISQHSLVRSLHLNERSSRNWTNLGALYLNNDDMELANEAFTRAQSADPEYAMAWIGQGLLAMLYGNAKDAQGLFLHAFEIADSSCLPANRHYATSAFDQMLKHGDDQSISDILQPLFALRQLQTQEPSDTITSHLLALCAERASEYQTAGRSLNEVCKVAEVEYEKSESTDFLVRYAQAKADLARAELGRGNYQSALENAETAIGLSEEELGTVYASQRARWRLSAHITAGLAQNQLGLFDQSIEMFRIALEESDHAPDVVCMLAQVLWARGDQPGKDTAREQLFACVENYPEHVQAVSLLAVIGLLDNDEDVLAVVQEDLKAFRISDKASVEEKMDVSQIIAGLLSCQNNETQSVEAITADAQQSVMLSPAQPQGWLELAQASDDLTAAEMALTTAMNQIPPRGGLTADELATAYASTGAANDAQVALMLAPWLLQTSDIVSG